MGNALKNSEEYDRFLKARFEVSSEIQELIENQSAEKAFEHCVIVLKNILDKNIFENPEFLFFSFWAIRLSANVQSSKGFDIDKVSQRVDQLLLSLEEHVRQEDIYWIYSEYFDALSEQASHSGRPWCSLAYQFGVKHLNEVSPTVNEGILFGKISQVYEKLALPNEFNDRALEILEIPEDIILQWQVKLRHLRLKGDRDGLEKFLNNLEELKDERLQEMVDWEKAMMDIRDRVRSNLNELMVKGKPHRAFPYLAHAYLLHIISGGSYEGRRFPKGRTLKSLYQQTSRSFHLYKIIETYRLPENTMAEKIHKMSRLAQILDEDMFQHNEEKLLFISALIVTSRTMSLDDFEASLRVKHSELSSLVSSGNCDSLYLPDDIRYRKVSHVPNSAISRAKVSSQVWVGVGYEYLKFKSKSAFASKKNQLKYEQEYYEAFAVKFADALKHLRGMASKLGQCASVFVDRLHPSIAKQLKDVHNVNNVINFADIKEVIHQQYGKGIDEVFASFDQTPIGIGSFGQVHKATLKNGDVVAVKVRMPGIIASIQADKKIMKTLGPLISFMFKGAKLQPIFQGIIDQTLREADYRSEVENLIFAKEVAKGHPGIEIPKIYEDLCTDEIIVMEFLEGQPVDEFARTSTQQKRNEVAFRFLDFHWDLVTNHKFVNIDPQVGNILVHGENIQIVDWGACFRLDDVQYEKRKHFQTAFISCNPDSLIKGFMEAGYLPVDSQVDPKMLYESMYGHIEPYVSNAFKFDRSYLTKFYSGIEGVNTEFNIPSDHLNIVRMELPLAHLLVTLEAEGDFSKYNMATFQWPRNE